MVSIYYSCDKWDQMEFVVLFQACWWCAYVHWFPFLSGSFQSRLSSTTAEKLDEGNEASWHSFYRITCHCGDAYWTNHRKLVTDFLVFGLFSCIHMQMIMKHVVLLCKKHFNLSTINVASHQLLSHTHTHPYTHKTRTHMHTKIASSCRSILNISYHNLPGLGHQRQYYWCIMMTY